MARVVRRLVGGAEEEVAGRRVELRDAGAPFDGYRREARNDERAGDDAMRLRERPIDVARSRRLARPDVRSHFGMQGRMRPRRGGFQVVHGFQRLVDDLDQRGGVCGLRGGFGGDRGDRLPRVERPPLREDGMRSSGLDRHAWASDAFEHGVCARVFSGDDGENAGRRERRACVYALDARVRVGAADDGGSRCGVGSDVVGELAGAAQKAVVLVPGEWTCRCRGLRSCAALYARRGGAERKGSREMARPEGIEPTTLGSEDRCSIR